MVYKVSSAIVVKQGLSLFHFWKRLSPLLSYFTQHKLMVSLAVTSTCNCVY